MLSSYLDNRFFRIKQHQEFSNLYPIESGVPQGSILGPMLYLLFTSDLPIPENSIVATFADDTCILADLHPKCVVQNGVLAKECAAIVSDFFRKKR